MDDSQGLTRFVSANRFSLGSLSKYFQEEDTLSLDYNKTIEIYCLINLIFIIAAYLLRDMEIEYSIKTTMERVVFTASGFYCFLLVDFLKNIFKKDK